MLATPPTGYQPLSQGFDESFDLDAAVRASVADPGRKRRLLKRLHFGGGRSRIWTSGDGYVSAVAYRLGSAAAAQQLVEFELDEAKTYVGTYSFQVPQISGAIGYVLSGSRRQVRSTLFCQSVWFARNTFTFNVNDCNSRPGATLRVVQLAQQQKGRAAARGD